MRREVNLARNRLVAGLSVWLVVCGCVATSSNPASNLGEGEPIPDFLLGAWEFVDILGKGEPTSESELIIDRGLDGSMTYILREGSKILQGNASLVTAGELKVISLSTEDEGIWSIALISFDETTQKMTVAFLGEDEVRQDIEQGLIEGEVSDSIMGVVVHLTAPGEELRAYFAAHPEVFGGEVVVFRKRTNE